VHVNEPGRTAWEGFATATRAAAAGGVMTVLDMPLNSIPPTCTVSALEIKQKAADGQCHVDVAFWGGAIPGNVADLRGLHDAGVFGFKSFMAPSGVEEFPPLSAEELDEYLAVLHTFDAMMIVHAETGPIERAPAAHGPGYADFLAPVRAARRTLPSPGSSRRPGTAERGCTCCTCPARTPYR
jgi:allantoinase